MLLFSPLKPLSLILMLHVQTLPWLLEAAWLTHATKCMSSNPHGCMQNTRIVAWLHLKILNLCPRLNLVSHKIAAAMRSTLVPTLHPA